MTNRDNNHRIKDHFAAGARDLTPASARSAAHVLFVPLSQDPEVSNLCASILSEAELKRAGRFAAMEDRGQFEQRRAFRRFCAATAIKSPKLLSKILFENTEKGRPFLADSPNLRFSFSSCRIGILGAWSSTHAIGVDIEDQSKTLETVDLAREFYSPAEVKALERVGGAERLSTFYRFWSLKEAALKSIGEGLPFGLDAFEFELDPELRIVRAPPDHGGPDHFEAHELEGTDSCAALAIRRIR